MYAWRKILLSNFQEKKMRLQEQLTFLKKVLMLFMLQMKRLLENVLGVVSKINTAIQFPEKRKKVVKKTPIVADENKYDIAVFTTRPDTMFGVSFMTLAPEHDLVAKITTKAQKEAVLNYIKATSKRSERERMADVKTISGVFTGAYAIHPFSGEKVPIWIGDYVLANYGTGAVMAVPCGDQRDYDFAKHFGIAIPNIFERCRYRRSCATPIKREPYNFKFRFL